MALKEEEILELPVSLLGHICGTALDFGGSVLKLVYLAAEDW